ncbi:MAG: XrtA system polysaccharide chain length determinant, partial [Herbaspirillum sp.]
MEQLIAQLLFAVKEVWKYRWYSIAIAWVVVIVGFATVYLLPSNYETSARVYVDTQTILKPLLSGMTTIPDVEQQVSIMSRTLLSRPNIERVMRMVDLDLSTKSVSEKEAVANKLMKDIKISGTSRNDIYTISYDNSNAKLAKNVVQSLLTIFIESSFGDKKQDSANAVRFIDDQIKQYEVKLQDTENAIKDFKLKNLGMTGKEGGFGGALASAEDMLTQARLDLTEAEQARNSIKREIVDESPSSTGSGTRKVARVDPEIEARIQSLNKTLDTYRLQYTEQHP